MRQTWTILPHDGPNHLGVLSGLDTFGRSTEGRPPIGALPRRPGGLLFCAPSQSPYQRPGHGVGRAAGTELQKLITYGGRRGCRQWGCAGGGAGVDGG